METIREVFKIRKEIIALKKRLEREVTDINDKIYKEIAILNERLNILLHSNTMRKERIKRNKSAQRADELKRINDHGYDIINGTWCREHHTS